MEELIRHGGVLIVDDEIGIRSIFRMVLADEVDCARIDTAENGQEAIRSFLKHRHDVLLMDLHMPVMDGVQAFEALRSLCARNEWVMPHVVFCTGYAPPPEIRDEIEKNNYHVFLMKPVTNELLVSTVRMVLRQADQAREKLKGGQSPCR